MVHDLLPSSRPTKAYKIEKYTKSITKRHVS